MDKMVEHLKISNQDWSQLKTEVKINNELPVIQIISGQSI